MSFSVTHSSIDLQSLRAALEDYSCGGAVFFEGRVRDHNEGRAVKRLEYEIYEPLAMTEGQKVIDEAALNGSIGRAVCVHRTGMLELGELAVVVGVAAAHRDEAFEAARYIIDEIKVRLPIWKREHYIEGNPEWVNCQRCAKAGGSHAQTLTAV